MGWAKASSIPNTTTNNDNNDDIHNSNNNNNNKSHNHHHHAATNRKDCWFCLASTTCEPHLIVTVNEHCYVAMPKGPADESHALVVSVGHSPSTTTTTTGAVVVVGAYTDPNLNAIIEVKQTILSLKKHASQILKKDLFVFERAIPTKGGYHAHVNSIPIPKGMGLKIRCEMLKMAHSCGFTLEHVSTTTNKEEEKNKKEENDDVFRKEEVTAGYFYVEIQIDDDKCERYLYTVSSSNNNSNSNNSGNVGNIDNNIGSRKRGMIIVPLQFGREVLASVLENESIAHWTSCVLPKEKEEELAEAFRKSLDTIL